MTTSLDICDPCATKLFRRTAVLGDPRSSVQGAYAPIAGKEGSECSDGVSNLLSNLASLIHYEADFATILS